MSGGHRDDLDPQQLVRLRKARWQWELPSLVIGLAFAAVVGLASALTPGLVPDPVPVVVFAALEAVFMAMVLPLTQLSAEPGRGSASRRALAVVAEPGDVRRVSGALRRGLSVTGTDVAIVRARLAVVRGQRRAIRGLLVGLVLIAISATVVVRSEGRPAPWGMDAVLLVMLLAATRFSMSLSRMITTAREQGIDV